MKLLDVTLADASWPPCHGFVEGESEAELSSDLLLLLRLSGCYAALIRQWTELTPGQVTINGPANHARDWHS